MKILVIRFSSIGDVLLTTPLLRCLKQQLPDCSLHFLTKSTMSQLLTSNPNVDRVVTLQHPLKKTIKQLRSEHYDFVVDLHNNHRSRLIRMRLSAKHSVYRKENFRKWLTILTKHDFMSGLHVVDRYFQAVSPLNVVNDGKGLQLPLPEVLSGEAFKTRMFGSNSVLQLTAHPYAIVACGAQHATKRIPLSKLMTLCSQIKGPVLLLGDKGDRDRLRNSDVAFSPNVSNLCGKTSLLESAALIRDAAVVVTPDSSMMHFAAAYHRPVIAVWGATVPEFGFWAYSTQRADCQVSNLRCRPCSRMGSERCPLGHFRCMDFQDWQRIAEAASQALAT